VIEELEHVRRVAVAVEAGDGDAAVRAGGDEGGFSGHLPAERPPASGVDEEPEEVEYARTGLGHSVNPDGQSTSR
jgi:hypothetical protein